MKYIKLSLIICMLILLVGCGKKQQVSSPYPEGAVLINLNNSNIMVDGKAASTDTASPVYTANDIIYYESGKDFTYGEGTKKEAHSAEDAAAHTVVHITKPGTYAISGSLSKGQIAVDLGENAKADPKAVVTLILNNVNLTCRIAPAIIFYNVYECGTTDAEKATKDVDTTAAGANVIIADGTQNNINGSYVARIYKPDSVVLNESGTAVEDAKKLHKYDGAFYSKMSMNINGGAENSGILNIRATNEGLNSELHLTINGGNINIYSGNDGINTNEDGVSVTTINGGNLAIRVTGETGEGDGIDSNGWLVIKGGSVTAAACNNSADSGIDSDKGIHISGGTVIASGNMLDRIEEGSQTYAVFNFAKKQSGSKVLLLKDEDGKAVMEFAPQNDCSVVLFSSPELKAGTYTLWSEQTQLAGYSGGNMGIGRPGMQRPEGGQRPEQEHPETQEGQQNAERPEWPKDWQQPEEGQWPESWKQPEDPLPEGGQRPENGQGLDIPLTKDFQIKDGANMFAGITSAE